MLVRAPDGSLHDAGERRTVTIEELLDGLRSGRRFRVHRQSTGTDCTSEVLREVLGVALLGPGPRTGKPRDLPEYFHAALLGLGGGSPESGR